MRCLQRSANLFRPRRVQWPQLFAGRPALHLKQEAAAQRLGVHRKTISYRLEKVSELTGLDLSTHDDRLVADLSLYVYRLLAGQRA